MRLIRPILWDRIVSAASPRVTSGDAADGQVEAFDRAMFSQCFEGILRTCRGEPAAWLLERRYAYLIKTHEQDERECLRTFQNVQEFFGAGIHFFLLRLSLIFVSISFTLSWMSWYSMICFVEYMKKMSTLVEEVIRCFCVL